RRYANVYTETSMRLSGLGEPGQWTPAEAVTWFRLIGIDRILFGTKWPLFDPRREIDAIRSLPLTPEERAKILGDNARRVLQIYRSGSEAPSRLADLGRSSHDVSNPRSSPVGAVGGIL